MSRKEKKELGLLFIQVVNGVRQLRKEGVITPSMSVKEAAVIYAASVASDEPTYEAWEKVEVGSVDWDALLAFIEKLLAIILPLFMNE